MKPSVIITVTLAVFAALLAICFVLKLLGAFKEVWF
jgi:hypothetical protein